MKAFVFSEKGRLEEKELKCPVLSQSVGGNEEQCRSDCNAAILAPVYISPCSSDAHTVFAGNGPRRDDLVLGHEGIARVVKVGSAVRDFKPGDIVAVAAVMPEPGDQTGHEGFPFSASKLGRNIDGMWSEYFRVPDADINLAHIPKGLSMESALMAVDMMATGFTAAEEAGINEESTVLIIGSGAVGLMAVQAAALKRAWRIYMLGTARSRLNAKLAAAYGADAYISYKDGSLVLGDEEAFRALGDWEDGVIQHKDPRANSTGSPALDTVFALTGGRGADKVIIAGGDSASIALACDATAYGNGTVVNVAYIEGSGMLGLPVFSLGRGMAGKTFRFCLSRGGRNWTERMLGIALAIEHSGGTPPGLLVTHRLKGFERIPEALELMHERPEGLIKVMVEIDFNKSITRPD